MTYVNNPRRLAELLQGLAKALEDQGVGKTDATPEGRLLGEAHNAAEELLTPPPGNSRAW